MADRWRIYDNDTIAYRLDRAELPGWLRKTVVVGPGEGAIVLRDGKPEALLTEGSDTVQGLFGGIANKLLGWLTGAHDVRVIFVDLNPVRVPIYLGRTEKREEAESATPTADGWLHARRSSQVSLAAVTADGEVVLAECVATLRLDAGDPVRIAGLLKDARALSRWDVAALVRDEALARVLVPHLSAVNAADLRGNRDLCSSIASWCRAELTESLKTHGLTLVDLVINWGLTEAEQAGLDRRRGEREEAARDFSHRRGLAELRRGLEIEQAKLDNLQQLKVAEAQGDESLKDLYLAGRLQRDALVDGRRVDTARIDAEVRVVRLGIEQKETALRLETRRAEQALRLDVEDRQWKQDQQQRLARIDADDKEMRGMVAMQIEMAAAKHDRAMAQRRLELDAEARRQQADADARFEDRKIRLQEDLARMSQVQALLSAGMAAGAVNADVLKTFLAESTRQSFGTTSDDKTAALFDSEKTKNDLDTFKDAQARERQQQRDMTGLSADLMQAAKQTPGPAVVLGAAASAPPAAPAAEDDVAVRLGKLKRLRDNGLIDDDEYKQRKAAILEEI